jgi:hypothetical protein
MRAFSSNEVSLRGEEDGEELPDGCKETSLLHAVVGGQVAEKRKDADMGQDQL